MSFGVSAGVYDRIVDRSHVINGGSVLAGGIVISSERGPEAVTTVTSAREFIELYGLPNTENPSKYSALRFLNRAGILTVKRVVNDAVAANGTLLDNTDPHLDISAENKGAWGNNLKVEFEVAVGEPVTNFFIIVLEDDVEAERFLVSRDVDAKDGYGNNLFIEDVVNTKSNLIRVTDYPLITGAYDLGATITLSGGSDDTTAVTSGAINIGWDDFLNAQAVPAQILINAGFAVVEVHTKMLAVAASRKDAVAILDVPKIDNADASAMITYKDSLGANTYYGGLYGGWLRVYDQYGDREIEVPPSGDIAANFIRTMQDGERWFAPAGVDWGIIQNALGVTEVFEEGDRDLLYSNGINPVTSHAGSAAIIWGQKTLQVQASAMDRFNVVNTVLWLNQRIREALVAFVFRINDQQTRDNVNFLISSFLENIVQRGGLYGFNVDTSTTINTPQIIDENKLLVDVYIQPVKAAEFIRVSTIITRTGVSFV